MSEAPSAGATFNAVADEKLARELVEQRKAEEKAKANAPVSKVSLEDLFSQIQAGEVKEPEPHCQGRCPGQRGGREGIPGEAQQR